MGKPAATFVKQVASSENLRVHRSTNKPVSTIGSNARLHPTEKRSGASLTYSEIGAG